MGNEGINEKFDDINIRVDFLIASCRSLQEENKSLLSKVEAMEKELGEKSKTQDVYAEQESMIQAKIDGLLTKLDGFTNTASGNEPSSI